MKKDNKIICGECKKPKPRRQMKRINGSWRCKGCDKIKRVERRELLKRDVCGIRKRSDLEKEWKKKREQRKKEQKILKKKVWNKTIEPKIKGSKNKKKSRQIHFYLTKDEKYILYLKGRELGLSSMEIDNKTKKVNEEMNKLAKKLRDKIKDDNELNKRFKEEFARLCEEFR